MVRCATSRKTGLNVAQGVWLEQLGFDRGDRIEVTAEREQLVLMGVREE
jgi:hypothetical protein